VYKSVGGKLIYLLFKFDWLKHEPEILSRMIGGKRGEAGAQIGTRTTTSFGEKLGHK
jgi:hypothetical protein